VGGCSPAVRLVNVWGTLSGHFIKQSLQLIGIVGGEGLLYDAHLWPQPCLSLSLSVCVVWEKAQTTAYPCSYFCCDASGIILEGRLRQITFFFTKTSMTHRGKSALKPAWSI
jgi:hypothetical protein